MAADQDVPGESLSALRAAKVEAEARVAEYLGEIDRLRETAAAAGLAKTEFLARMSHEIRTPLNAIIGLSGLALKTGLSPRQEDYLRKIRSSAHALAEILTDVIDFARLSAGEVELVPAPFHLRDLFDRLAQRFSGAAAKKGVALTFELSGDAPPLLRGDHLRLEQVLAHLVGNAVKFTDAGHIEVRAEGEAGGEGGKARLRFSVRDTGPGIDPATIPLLLESFTQGDGSLSRRHGGTGLGLSVVRELLGLFGSTLGIDSAPGRGSRFFFSLDLERPGETRSEALEELRGKRVLVVDDDPVSRRILTDQVKSFGFEPAEAPDAATALALLASRGPATAFDAVILDWMLPGEDGLRTAERIRTMAGLARRPALIMVSAHGREDVARQAEEHGVAAFLLKPVTRSCLYDALVGVFRSGAPAPLASSPDDGPAAGAGLSGSRILVVEDNAINQQVVREILEGFGAAAVIAANGALAVEAVAREAFDVVLMDVQMPVMDGLTATRRIRAMPGQDELPIIALTAHALEEDRRLCLEAGMNDYVTKPIDPERLLAVLGQWIAPARGAGDRAVGVGRPDGSRAGGRDTAPDRSDLDLDAALRRLGGNRTLLYGVIKEFARDYAGSGQAIADDLAGGDPDSARRLAHTVKGVAGNISADRLAGAARELEQALRSGETDVAGLVGVYRQALDAAVAAIDRAVATEERGQASGKAPGLLILLVDDARLNRTIFAQIVEDAGHEVVTAENGKAACRALFGGERRERPFDLILMDIEMPEMDGIKATRTIRGLLRASAKPPCRPDIPIIALTSHGVSEERERCLGAGMDDCVHKSFESGDLLEVIEQCRQGGGVGGRHGGVPAEKIVGLARTLAESLRRGNIRAEEDLAELKAAAGRIWAGREAELIEERIGIFDFKSALAALERVAAGLGWSLGDGAA